MNFGIKDLMIQVLPEETWHACTCTVGTNQCGQCTDVSGDLDGGDDEEPDPTPDGTSSDAVRMHALAAVQEQLRQALATEARA